MPDLPISQLPNYTVPADNDLLVIVDIANNITKQIKKADFMGVLFTICATYADFSAAATGTKPIIGFVTADETNGGNSSMYLYFNSNIYYLPLVKNS